MRLLAATILLTGCASATATIAREANDVRASAVRARANLEAAQLELVEIEQSAAAVHQNVAYVQDTENPVWVTMQFVSAAVGLAAVAAIVYKLKR